MGKGVRTAPTPRTAERVMDADSWLKSQEWIPHDNENFALDANDSLYNFALEGNVMDDLPPVEEKKKEKKKKSKLSVCCL